MTATRTATLALVSAAIPVVIHAHCESEPARAQRDAVLEALLGWHGDLCASRRPFTARRKAAAEAALTVFLAWLPCANREAV